MSKLDLTKSVKPDDIDTSGHLFNTFGKHEKEAIARNIIIISGKDWNWFTWEDYKKKCNHDDLGDSEYDFIKGLAEDNLLDDKQTESGQTAFKVNSCFIMKIWNFVKE